MATEGWDWSVGPEGIKDHPTPGMAIWGWMAPAELEWLMAQARGMDSVAEIGCLHGRSAFALLTACSGPVYCVDPWDDEGDQCYTSFLSNCKHFDNLRAVRGYSPAAADQVPDVDMTFIDGDHAYESVVADIEAWLPKTRRLICGHDYQNENGGFPGVAQAVHELFGERLIEPGPESAIWSVEL